MSTKNKLGEKGLLENLETPYNTHDERKSKT